MARVIKWYHRKTKRVRDSISFSIMGIGFISTLMTILGFSLGNWFESYCARFFVVLLAGLVIYFSYFYYIGETYKGEIDLMIGNTPVFIGCGNIFNTTGWKVIGCDTHFDTRVDDIVISKKSLHGQLVLEHGTIGSINAVVEQEAKKLNLKKNSNGQYDFELGTVIKYESVVDNETYLMLALSRLDEKYKAYTNIADFEQTLITMWNEIDRVYAGNDIVLPLLGTGITRFKDGPKGNEPLLRCMLCTLNNSGISLKSKVKIVIYGEAKDIPLYEYKDMFRMIPGCN